MRAEKLIENEVTDFSTVTAQEMKSIVHELNVYQIELEMQNDQLQITYDELKKSNTNFSLLFDNAPVGYLRLDDNGLILKSNITFQTLLGYYSNEINGQFLAKFIHPDDLGMFTARYNAFRKRPENKTLEFQLITKNKQTVFVEIKGRIVDFPVFNESDETSQDTLLINVLEIGDRKQMEDELKLAAEVFNTSEAGIMITSPDSKIMKVNTAFTTITGYEDYDVIGKMANILHSGRQSRVFYTDMWQHLIRDGLWQGEVWNRRKNGDVYPEWLSISSVLGKFGKVTHYIGVFTDITQRKLSEDKIEKLAHFDNLTGLPNRTLLHDRLNQLLLLALRNKRSFIVLFLDLDRFKILNDTLGHYIGDMLLQDVSRRLLACVRESDTVARFGGDEFVIVLSDFQNEESATQKSAEIAANILDSLSTPFQLEEHQYVSSTSIGSAIFPRDGQSISSLLKNADTAMYYAKEHGRNNYQCFSQKMHDETLKHNLMVTDISNAILNDQFTIYYQPKVDLKNNSIIGFEALVRWLHPQKGLVCPDDFIPNAEKSDIIIELGNWILKTACRQLKTWHNAGYDNLTMSVNLSARQFTQSCLDETVKKALTDVELDAKYLDLEITETLMMKNMTDTSITLKKLVHMGCSISLDDFGTGYSSLTYLKKFPVQNIKIDRSFVQDIMTDEDDQVIVQSILAIAQSMHLNVIAEGVETEAQADYLIKQGCEIGQGYYYFKPHPAEYWSTVL